MSPPIASLAALQTHSWAFPALEAIHIAGRILAAVSLLLWLAILACGRAIAYI